MSLHANIAVSQSHILKLQLLTVMDKKFSCTLSDAKPFSATRRYNYFEPALLLLPEALCHCCDKLETLSFFQRKLFALILSHVGVTRAHNSPVAAAKSCEHFVPVFWICRLGGNQSFLTTDQSSCNTLLMPLPTHKQL